MINQKQVLEKNEESNQDDIIVVIEDYQYDDDDYEWVECMDCVQRKMICLMTILIIGIILLIFVYTISI